MRFLMPFAVALSLSCFILPASAADKPAFRIAWTIYAGSMPLGYAEDAGILDKWGERYGIEIEAVQLNDYIEAQNQYTAGAFDGVIAITLDAITIPAASGVDSTAAVMLNASDGSDGMVMKGTDKTIKDLQDSRVNLVQFSGSHYLLARALDKNGMSERDLTVVNTSDADIIAAFQSSDSQAVVTWKPQLSEILNQAADSTLLFDSADIPNEITDILLVHTDTLEQHPELGEALAGAWYEVMSMMQPDHPKYDEVMGHMANAVGTDRDGFLRQTETIHFFEPQEAVELVSSESFAATLDNITSFAWDKGLLGPGASGPDYVGIEFADGDIQGDNQNVNLRFPIQYMKKYAQ